MNNYKNIFWISSYPKSGNTWLRLIFYGVFLSKDGKIDNLNILNKIPKLDTYENFKFIKNISLNDYNKIFKNNDYNEEATITLSKYWLEAQKRIKIKQKFNFFKTHNARLKFKNYFYTDDSTTKGFIYIVRDPRDIVISYSKHLNKDTNSTIKFILTNNILGNQKTENKMPEFIYNWKGHYRSWKTFVKVPNLIIRYEDLLYNIDYEINKIIDFFYKNYNIEVENKKEKIKNIIESTKFENLQNIENKTGFAEKSEHSNFFRIGKKNQWSNQLTENQKSIIEKYCKKEMIELKYI